MGGVSWLPAKLFDLEHDPWMGLPCTPRPKVRYFGTDETVLSEEMVLQHAIARQLQSSLSARKQAAELLRVFRAQKDPLATARHLRGETVVGVSDAEGAPEVTRSRGGKRSRGAADNDPAEGMFIPGCGWLGVTLWEEGSREPLLQAQWKNMRPILIPNLPAAVYAAAVERRRPRAAPAPRAPRRSRG